jgi:thiosulfate/3-mercaptopyruvate sulfurtransferase
MLKKVTLFSLIAALFSTAIVPSASAVTESTPTKALVSTTWLKANLADPNLILLHVGDADNAVYARTHIEGAQYIDWKTELANSSESKLKNGVVTRGNFDKVVKRLGVTDKSTVVLYHEGKSNLRATWGAWVFNLYGHPDVRLLDGGLQKWTSTGGATTFAATPAKATGTFKAKSASTKLRAKIEEVILNAKKKAASRAIIVDTRDSASYEGKGAATGLGTAAKAGHIATAKSIPTANILNSDGTFKSAADIKAAYAAVGVTKDTKVILYCGTGLLASASWFALTQILGNTNVKNYDGSWFEFAATAPEAVIETVAASK